MSARRSHPSELDWARHLAGEAGRLAGWRLRRHLATCAACRRRDAELDDERRAFDADPRRREELARLSARLAAAPHPPARPSWPRVPWILAGGAVAAAIVTAAVRIPGPSERLAEKGGDAFTLYVDRPAGAVALGDRCAPGDRIIGRYRTSRPYLLVLERDGRGLVQVLAPQDGAASMRLPAAEGTTPTSWILDAAPGQECFTALFSDEPLGAAAASQALAATPGAPALPGVTVRVSCCDKAAAR